MAVTASGGQGQRVSPIAQLRTQTSTLLTAMLTGCLLLQLHLIFAQPINWDEFRFLADVHLHSAGRLERSLQTFHVHLFGWLTSGIGDEIDQITAARFVMLLAEAGTAIFIIRLTACFVGVQPALLAGLAYVSFSFVMHHGASFRFDPLSTFLLMAAAGSFARDRLRPLEMILAGLAASTAILITMKSVFYLPPLIALAVYSLVDVRSRRWNGSLIALAGLSGAIFLAALYAFHVGSLAAANTAAAGATVAGSYEKTLAHGVLVPRLGDFLVSISENPIHWALMIMGMTTAARQMSLPEMRGQAWTLLALAFPLGSILFYRNAFPYFYAFMLAPASVLIGLGANRPALRPYLLYLAVAVTGGALFHHQSVPSGVRDRQTRVVAAAHEIFPEGVPYIDRCSMISSFPQAGLFLSSWGIENYLGAGRPIMRQMLLDRKPVFLIANSPILADALGEADLDDSPRRLLPEDRITLRENFIHHWGPVYVLGKIVDVSPATEDVEILVGGTYTLEGAGAVSINGRVYTSGETLRLTAGNHSVRSIKGLQRISLRWGERLKVPADAADSGPLFASLS